MIQRTWFLVPCISFLSSSYVSKMILVWNATVKIQNGSENTVVLFVDWLTIDFNQDRKHRIDQVTQNNRDEKKVHQRYIWMNTNWCQDCMLSYLVMMWSEWKVINVYINHIFIWYFTYMPMYQLCLDKSVSNTNIPGDRYQNR